MVIWLTVSFANITSERTQPRNLST